MKNPLEQRLSDNKDRRVPSLVLFATAGYPSRDSTVDLVLALEEGGADAVELGMPFSDPMADGPMIQRSSAVALSNGVTIASTLEQVSVIRQRSSIPIILMGYVNPILRYGIDRFFTDAGAAGVHGVILPEVPLDEWMRFQARVEAQNLSGILLVTPTTTDERLRRIDEVSSGFLYAVSSTGVTGGSTDGRAIANIKKMRALVRKNPMLVGFGVSTPKDALAFSRVADGVVIGSALLREIEGGKKGSDLVSWVQEFRSALTEAG
jgi:tryptophan synthase alpha chain